MGKVKIRRRSAESPDPGRFAGIRFHAIAKFDIRKGRIGGPDGKIDSIPSRIGNAEI